MLLHIESVTERFATLVTSVLWILHYTANYFMILGAFVVTPFSSKRFLTSVGEDVFLLITSFRKSFLHNDFLKCFASETLSMNMNMNKMHKPGKIVVLFFYLEHCKTEKMRFFQPWPPF